MIYNLILKLHSLGAIKFGTFEIKKDFTSPILIDLSIVISHPIVAKMVCEKLWEKGEHLSFDLVCGVPLLGACFANYIAWEHELPLVIRRTEAKALATKIVGAYKSGQKCLVVQDLQLWGQHTLDTIDDLQEEGLEVRDVVTLIDFGMGGKKKMKNRGFVSHSVISIGQVLEILDESGKVAGDQIKLARDFFAAPAEP